MLDHVNKVSPVFVERLKKCDEFDIVGNTRGIGLIGAMEFAAEKHSRKKFDKAHKIAAQAVAIIQKHGVILRALPGDIIGFCPPLIISKLELDDMFKRIHDAMLEVAELAAKLR